MYYADSEVRDVLYFGVVLFSNIYFVFPVYICLGHACMSCNSVALRIFLMPTECYLECYYRSCHSIFC